MLKINKESILIGGDPEVFLRTRVDKKLVSAIGLIPGSKSNPSPVPHLGKGFCVQTDNVAAEFNVPPVKSYTAMYNNYKAMIEYIESIIPADLEVVVVPSGEFTDEECSHPDARLSGCSADYNAWSLSVNPKADYSVTNIRAAAAHIHISYDNNNDDTSIELIKALDLFAAVPSVLFDDDVDRRKLYGKAGCFRMCPWGIEYRSLNNTFIKDLDLVKFVFDAVDKAVDWVNAGKEFTDEDSLNIQTAINTNDKDLALELVYKFGIESILPVVID